ncbi:recombinase RecA [Neisseria sp. Ec49-e6-T10]|uniref:recombinase RecA n=1 Tax=Neisseria sp. Ec49-e6-T10 TaxID=3140744 RepID=UPI003EBFD8CB
MVNNFSNEQKALMLTQKGVGETVIKRLEEIGICSFKQLANEDAQEITQQIAQMLGATCWANSPQARKAIEILIDLAKQHQN